MWLDLFLARLTLADKLVEALDLLYEGQLLAFLVAIVGLLCHLSLLILVEAYPADRLYLTTRPGCSEAKRCLSSATTRTGRGEAP